MKTSTSILLVVVFVLIGRLSLITEPYGVSVDESTYLSMAEVLHDGGVLYKDVVDRKPPALIWLYQGVGEVFGEWNLAAVQWTFVLLIFLLCYLAYQLSSLLFRNREAGIWAAILFAAFSSCFPRGILAANAETPMTLCLALSFILLLKARGAKSWALVFLSVFTAAIATLFKQYAGIIYAVFYLAWVGSSWKVQNWFLKNIVYAGVAVLALLAVYLPLSLYFSSVGAGDEFLYYFVFDGLNYISGAVELVNNDTSWQTSVVGIIAVWLPMWIAIFLRRSFSNSHILAWAMFIGSLSTAFLSGRYYTHYFFPAIWAICVLASDSWAYIVSQRPRWALALKSAALVIFVFFIFFNLERDRFKEWSFSLPVQQKMQRLSYWIKKNTDEDERIVVWGMASQIYVMSERGSGTRFVFSDFVSGRQPGMKSDVSIPIEGKSTEFIQDLRENKPELIIDTSGAKINDYGFFPLESSEKVFEYVEDHYEIEDTVEEMTVWRLQSTND